MKKANKTEKKTVSLAARILAGALVVCLAAGTLIGVLVYLV